jgi:hypothetical protein
VSENKFDWEDQIDHESRMYQRGKSIALDIENQGISESNAFEFQSYIDDLSEEDLRAYAFYDENRNTPTDKAVLKPIRFLCTMRTSLSLHPNTKKPGNHRVFSNLAE